MSKSTLLALLCVALTSPLVAAQSRQFLQAPQYSTGASSNPQAFAVADFNNDGIPDVAVANANANSVSIFLGNGDGTFTQVNCGSTLNCATGTNPQGIAAADFNQDGNMDLAVTNFNSNTITILFGNGQGAFSVQPSVSTGTNPRGIAAADFSGDGYPDIVVANSGSNNVGLLLNNGSGGFGTETTYSTGLRQPWAVAVGDFNNDQILDIVVGFDNIYNLIEVFLGQTTNGAFSGFGPQSQYSTGSTQGAPISVAVGDLNGDGNLDVAVAVQSQQGTTGSDMVSIMLGDGTGALTLSTSYNTAPDPVSVVAANLNGDGNLDLAVAAGEGNIVTVFWGNGDGTFGGQVNCGTGDIPSAVAAANLTNAANGTNDLIISNAMGNSFSVIMNNGNDTFESRLDYVAGPNPESVVMADLHGKGIPDLAFADSNASQISVTLGNGDGTFQPPTSYTTGTATDPVFIVEGDFNQDGIPDLAVVNNATSTVSVFLGQATNGVPNGTFAPHVDYKVGNPNDVHPVAEPTSIAVGDFNGDGYPDLAVTNSAENSVTILLNGGKASPGTFALAPDCTTTQNACPVGNGPIAVAAGYFGGNQTLDLVVINESDGTATILLGNGDGTFTPEAATLALGSNSNPVSVAVADLNGDGILDLAVADQATQQVSILLGNGSGGVGNGTFQTAVTYSTGPNSATAINPTAVVIGDFNGDGIPDLALAGPSSGATPGNQVSLLLGVPNSQGTASGTFGTPALFGVGYLSSSLVTGDFNLDGALDLAVANPGSNTVSILLNLQGTAIGFTPPGTSIFGQSVTLTATVTASVPNSIAPTGTVTFENGSTILGSPNLSGGSASISTSSLPVGTDSLTAVYSGDSNYQPHTVYASITVSSAAGKATPSVVVTANPASANLNESVTLTSTVSGAGGVPTGTVTFFSGTTQLGSATLNGGVATYATSSLAAGTDSITASYSGDSNFLAGTSLPMPIVVTAPNFSLTSNALTPNSIAPGATAVSTVTISAVGGLNPGSVQLTCTVSPAVTPAATCQVGSVTVASGQGTATLTFKAAGPTSALLIPNENPGSNMLFAFGMVIPAMLLGGAGLSKPGRRKLTRFCLFLVLAGCMAHMACGGGSSGGNNTTPPPSGNSGTPAGAYQVMVSGSVSGIQSSISTPLSVTVQ
jgi:hypothetical protein